MLKQVKPFNDNESNKETFCQTGDVIVENETYFTSNNAILGVSKTRARRQAARGRFRGQTQSQYLAIDHGSGKDEGKAEAHSNADSSRASVSKYFFN